MQVAVTAASGRLGHAILRELSREIGPDRVIGVARDPGRIGVPGIERRAGDYTDRDGMVEALRGADTAIMISAPVKPGTDRIRMHRNVIAAAREAGVRKLLFTSVIGNGGEAGTHFEATQRVNRQAEDDLRGCGLEWVVGRNALYIELDLGHIIRANAEGVYRNNAQQGRCGYLTIDELAHAFAKLAIDDRHNGRIYNLVGENRTQAELVAEANRVFGLNLRYEPISFEENVARFMQDEAIAARGEEVAKMLAGCFECIAKGAFDVPSDFEAATGRPAKSIRRMMEEVREKRAAAA